MFKQFLAGGTLLPAGQPPAGPAGPPAGNISYLFYLFYFFLFILFFLILGPRGAPAEAKIFFIFNQLTPPWPTREP